MITEHTVSNRVKFRYQNDDGKEDYAEISVINDDGEQVLCRVDVEAIVEVKNYWDATLQFAIYAAQKKQSKSKLVGATLAGIPNPPGQ